MLLNARLLGLAMVLGAALLFALLVPGRGALQAVEETPAPLPPPATPTPGMLVSPISTPVVVQPGQPIRPLGPICVAEGAFPGGQTFQSMNLLITLPPIGTYNVFAGHSEVGGTFVSVCYVEGDASIHLQTDGVERRRAFGPMGSAAVANPVLDEIARSVQVLPPPSGAGGQAALVTATPGGGNPVVRPMDDLPGNPICTGAGSYMGGQIVDMQNLRFTLPVTSPSGGRYDVTMVFARSGGQFVRVCFQDGDAAVFFSPDGRETERFLSAHPDSIATTEVLDRLAKSVRLLSPPPTPQPRCEGRGSTGGGTHIEFGAIAFDLPPGDFIITRNNDEFGTVFICYIQGNVGMLMHTNACSVLSRDDGLPEANAVLDQLIASCVVVRPPASLQTFPHSQTPIRPPDTGDGGLIVR